MSVDTGNEHQPKDLAAATFVAIASALLDEAGSPVSFTLPDKANVQDDPFDQYVARELAERLPDDLYVIPSSGPLTSPDVVIARPDEYHTLREGGRKLDARSVIALEVKKLERTSSGKAARGSGMDYNTTPPSEAVKVTAEDSSDLWIPGYYLFVVLDSLGSHTYQAPTSAVVTGGALNKDTDLYDRITGVRTKAVGLGTYGDGADRQRPMLVFSNPLGWDWLADSATLIHERDDLAAEQDITKVREMVRTAPHNGQQYRFFCYRPSTFAGPEEDEAQDPFPSPENRTAKTSPRGRFVISFSREVR